MTRRREVPEAWVHHIQLKAEDPETLAGFYAETLLMDVGPVEGGFKCEGAQRRVLFTRSDDKQVGLIGFAFETAEDLGVFKSRLAANGTPMREAPTPLFGGDAIAVSDPDGNVLAFGVAARDTDAASSPLGARLQHVTLRSTDMAPMIAFYRDTLGFFFADQVEDETGDPRACFFTLDHEHHSLAFFKADSCRIDHHSYELEDWNQIRDWADHFAARGLQLRWGPGRHGPGNNLFIFIDDPEGNWIELSAEIEVMGEDRELEIWPHDAKTLNLWGDAIMRS
ncbi:MAG: VOC family protein [Hyphomicrobiales bacterium]